MIKRLNLFGNISYLNPDLTWQNNHYAGILFRILRIGTRYPLKIWGVIPIKIDYFRKNKSGFFLKNSKSRYYNRDITFFV